MERTEWQELSLPMRETVETGRSTVLSVGI